MAIPVSVTRVCARALNTTVLRGPGLTSSRLPVAGVNGTHT